MNYYKFTHYLTEENIHILATNAINAYIILNKHYSNISDYYLN